MTGSTPDIRSPFPYQISPYAEQARAHVRAWARDTGLVHAEAAQARLERADYAGLAAVAFPTASRTHVELVADWIAWAFLLDDHLDCGSFGRDPRRAQSVCDQMCAVLRAPGGAGAGAASAVPKVVSALADLWSRTSADAGDAWRARFVAHLTEGLQTLARWEAPNRARDVVPDLHTYVEMRRRTGGMYPFLDLIAIGEHIDLPDTVYTGAQFAAALAAACNVVVWTNDVYSLAKERAGGEFHNLVRVVEHHRRLGHRAALAHVKTMITSETESYLGHEMGLLRAYPEHAAALVPYAAGMRTWMRGNLDWSRRTPRYRTTGPGPQGSPDDHLEPALVESRP
ncbi:terpene synthase family protein [Streptomyces sp. NPDC001537]